jgi:hypothetical protein
MKKKTNDFEQQFCARKLDKAETNRRLLLEEYQQLVATQRELLAQTEKIAARHEAIFKDIKTNVVTTSFVRKLMGQLGQMGSLLEAIMIRLRVRLFVIVRMHLLIII